jgi:GNAT superfamily N-acetyltransferase
MDEQSQIQELLLQITATLTPDLVEYAVARDPQLVDALAGVMSAVNPAPETLPPEIVEMLRRIENKGQRFREAVRLLGVNDPQLLPKVAEVMQNSGLLAKSEADLVKSELAKTKKPDDYQFKVRSTTLGEFNDDGDEKPVVHVTAHSRGRRIGQALFEPAWSGDQEKEISALNVFVEAKHRRRGVASRMYELAEKHSGKKTVPAFHGDQTEDAEAFWANPKRTFGKSEPLEKADNQHKHHHDVAADIAADDELFHAVAQYTAKNPNIFREKPELAARLEGHLRRVKPFKQTLYRGEPAPSLYPGDWDRRGMPAERPHEGRHGAFASWSSNHTTAKEFARDHLHNGNVRVTPGPVQGVSLSNIVAHRNRLRPEENLYEGMQAEWLVLHPHADYLKKAEDFEPLKKGKSGDWRSEGYTFKLHPSRSIQDGPAAWKEHRITAHGPDGEEVGAYGFQQHPPREWTKNQPVLTVQNALTRKPHQRKGLASEAYRMIEEHTGLQLHPDGGHNKTTGKWEASRYSQTNASRALWNQPNRNFGADNIVEEKNGTTYPDDDSTGDDVLAPKPRLRKSDHKGYEIGHTNGIGYCEECAVHNDSDIRVHALKDGEEVGHAHIRGFSQPEIYAAGIQVHPDHRRNGLATAMYTHAEKVTGKKMKPSDAQSEDAQALWAQPNRPFGKSEDHWSFHEWLEHEDTEARDKLPELDAKKFKVAVTELAAATKTRKNPKTKETEFLLHRGHHKNDPELSDPQLRTSWTPKHDVAQAFAGKEGKHGRVTSAWIPESRIVTIPKHHVTGSEHHRNRLEHEHEVVVYPHKYAKTTKLKKSESLEKSNDGYVARARAQIGLLYPVTIRGVKNLREEIPFHITVKSFDPAQTQPEEVLERLQGAATHPPALHNMSLHAETIKSKLGNTYHVLALSHTPKHLQDAYDRLDGIGVTPPVYRPHITVDKKLWDEVKEKGLTPADLKLEVHPLELRHGSKVVHRFTPDMRKDEIGEEAPAPDTLEKMGAVHRKFPFNPMKDVPEYEANYVNAWQKYGNTEDDPTPPENVPEIREKLDEIHPHARVRALNRLANSTSVKRDPATGKRLFLLHRGGVKAEVDAAVSGDRVRHETRTSWTPHQRVAKDFTKPSHTGDMSHLGEQEPGSVMSAWIHEDKILHMPKMYGNVHNPWAIRGSSNEYSEENEVIVEPHESTHATPEEIGNRASLHDYINQRLANISTRKLDPGTIRAVARERLKKAQEHLLKALHPHEWKAFLSSHIPRYGSIVDHEPHAKRGGVDPGFQEMLNSPETHRAHTVVTDLQQLGEKTGGDAGITNKLIHKNVDTRDGVRTFMMKPYHRAAEKGTEYMASMPIFGWSTMATKSLFRAGGISHLAEDVRTHIHNTVPVTVHKFAEGYQSVSAAHRNETGGAAPNYNPLQLHQIGVMDYLTGNIDRHGNNLLVSHGKNQHGYHDLLAIDHDRNFQYHINPKGMSMLPTSNMETLQYVFNGIHDHPSHYLKHRALNSVRERTPNWYHSGGALREWWLKNRDGIGKAMDRHLEYVKDETMRNHIANNFRERFGQINKWADTPELHEKFNLFDKQLPMQTKHHRLSSVPVPSLRNYPPSGNISDHRVKIHGAETKKVP